ncbi:MAG TPA: cell wall hydrolase [Sphingomicrobium sp.]|nr:cell wall hydrolase [Sphingomicrobium sp.]
MTGLALARRRLAASLSAWRLEIASFAFVLIVALTAAAFAFETPGRVNAPVSVTASLDDPLPAALLAATSDGVADAATVGEEAKVINAALPFSSAPLEASRPFALGGGDLDYRRAHLCLTQAVYYEAGFEPIAGRRAVAQVVLNRMRHPAFPNSVCGVVYQVARAPVCQFSFVCDGSLGRAPASSAWREARDIAAAALAGYVEKSVGAATHYHADYVAPRWAPMLTKLTKLGAHIFYRWPGGWGRQGAFTGRYAGELHDPASLAPPAVDTDTGVSATVAAGPITDGTVIKRAPNDVGGLLDVSKGWKLDIPHPEDIGGAAARAIAQQQDGAQKAGPVAAAGQHIPVMASR